jgi:hypothetical protein
MAGGDGSTPVFTQPLSQGNFGSAGQHGPLTNHLPPVQQNIEVVGKLEMETPNEFRFDPDTGERDELQPDVVPGQIADLAVYKNTAYLDSWSEPSCRRGGFFSVDISNPSDPEQLAFVPALDETYHGEGAQARTINTAFFSGDILAVNNEPCGLNGVGGFDLYDVSDPANPKILVQGAGDQSPDHDAGEAFADTTQDPAEVPNSAHSIFIWQDGPRAFAVIVDNTELSDVDIFDITNPSAPAFIADVDLVELGVDQGMDIVGNSANGNTIFHHDMVVKEIGGIQTMLVSYWDAGYLKLNVEDPANPVIIGDSDFGTEDPLVEDPRTPGQGYSLPEGNGHEAEFSHDNKFVLSADEDFSTYRTDFEITSGTNAGPYGSGEFGFTKPIATLPDQKLNGPTVFGGYGCPVTETDSDPSNDIPPADSEIPPASLDPGEEQILVVQRGPVGDPSAPFEGCRFDEKIANGQAKGYDGVIIGQRHQGDEASDGVFCGSGDPRDIPGMCVTHEAMHLIFDDPPGYGLPYPPGHGPALGANGADVAATARFDGWGYTHLYRNEGGTLTAVDHYAIDEAVDERFATGFGALSVHEFATDPTEYLAYSAYYAGGMRVVRFGDAGMEQVGAFIDERGNDFWGVEQFTTPQGERLFAGSDRDYGLYLFRYTGPGAAQKPVCSDTTALVPFKRSTSVPLTCSDANSNPLSESIVTGPANGSVSGDAASGAVTYTHRGNSLGPADSFTFKANDGAADSNLATAGMVAVPGNAGRCANPFTGSRRRDIIVGSRFGDRIRGRRGNDVLEGRRGRDCLFGQTGADDAFGGRGNDSLSGGRGNDRLVGGGGRNRLSGGAGNDTIGANNNRVDRIRCGRGFDRVRADANDRIAAGCENVVRR